MDGSDHHCLIRFREYRARLIAKPEELFRETTPGSNLGQLLYEYLQQQFSGISSDITLLPVSDFAWSTLTPFCTAEILLLAPALQESERDILCQDFTGKTLACGQPLQFLPLNNYTLTSLPVPQLVQLLSANPQWVIGNHGTFTDLVQTILSSIQPDIEEELCKSLRWERAERFKTFGDRPALVEPNLKFSAGGFSDVYLMQALQVIINRVFGSSATHPESMIDILLTHLTKSGLLITSERDLIRNSFYQQILFRHAVHVRRKDNRDWFEWPDQYALYSAYSQFPKKDSSGRIPLGGNATEMMKQYYQGAKSIFRTVNSLLKHILYEEQKQLPEYLEEQFDNNLALKLGGLYLKNPVPLNLPLIMELFYYRGKFDDSWFNDKLRNDILAFDGIATPDEEIEAFTCFRKILQLEKNVGATLTSMHELDYLGKFLPAFAETQGLGQQGAYYYYTTDEHTLRSICFLDSLNTHGNYFGKVFNSLKNPELLYLALLFHDIAKPLGLEGHEVMGAEFVQSFMEKFGYEEQEIEIVAFLTRSHFSMQRVAFRRDLQKQEIIDTFAAIFPSPVALDYLFLLSYAILAAVNPKIFTNWKENLLITLYKKTKIKLESKISDHELIKSSAGEAKVILRHHNFDRHLSTFDDPLYAQHFTELEIQHHIEKIESGDPLSMYFLEENNVTKFTVITKDSNYLLSKICGVLAINDIDIHDARIFTRNDGIVVDTFSLTDTHTGRAIPAERHAKIESDLHDVISGLMQLAYEIKHSRTNWKAFRRAILKQDRKVRIKFESHDVYSVILIHAPDMHGFLYQVTRKMNELGLHIYFAKIATEQSGIYDAFYVLDRNKAKLSTNYYHFIEAELKEVIEKL